MAREKSKRARVPEILWKMFGKGARSVGDTVLAITGKCRCKQQRRCLSCGGMSHLLRPDDPPDYRRLINKCFAVVSQNSPPFPRFDPNSHWPQREIVTRSIEMIMHDQPSSQNLLCNGYDKVLRSSAVVNVLTSSAWTLLLRRVGDALMIYLLKYASIFLPLPRNNFQQIAGFPISDFCCKIMRNMSDPQFKQLPFVHQGLAKKRKRFEGIESTSAEQPYMVSLGSKPSSCSSFACTNGGDDLTQSGIHSYKKHKRQYCWQRLRRHRQSIKKTSPVIMHSENCSNSDTLSRGLQGGLDVGLGQDSATNVSDYPCSAGFQNIKRMSRNSEIDRRNIFYRLETSASMLPKKHILYALRPNNSGAIILFKNIFGTSDGDKNLLSKPCLHSKCFCHTRSTCLYRSFIKLLKNLIANTQNCPYLKLLDKHCSITPSCRVTNTGTSSVSEGNDSETNSSSSGRAEVPTEGKSSYVAYAKNWKMIPRATAVHTEPSNSYCPKKQVVSFIWAVCRRVVPSSLLGSPSNQRVLRKNISKFIHLRKFEKFSLKDCMHELKLLKFPLLSKIHCGCSKLGISDLVRHAILDCWVFCFFASLVSPLVQANFYVTESEHVKQDVLYYHNSTWEKLMREAQKCLVDKSYHQLNHSALQEILINRPFGFSRARLRPKQFGFRVLANLQAPSRLRVNSSLSRIHIYQQSQNQVSSHSRDARYKLFNSVNSVLRDSHVVLSGLRTTEPEKLGSSVFDYNDVYRKLVPFLFLLKNGSSTMPAVYIVVSDVSRAFDSVDQEKLLSVMKDVVMDDEYTLEKIVQVIRTKKSLKVHQQKILAHQDTGANSLGIRSQPGHALDSILIKKELSRIMKGSDINVILKEHITRNVVKIHCNFYLQQVGIPQGSVLSTLLCSFYYGHMERTVVFPFLEKIRENLLGKIDACKSSALENTTNKKFVLASEYLLLRFVDDYILISTSKKQASMFFSRLERGVRDYNCCMNKEKYGLNFDINNADGSLSDRVYTGKDGISFLRWSGLLINSQTVEVQADYTRYLNAHLHTTVTVIRQGKVGRHLREKLRDYLRPKCHPIFYDSNINSPGVVRLNIYHVFLLCSMKFICYISKLSTITKFSPKFYFNAITASLRYMSRLIKRRMYSRLSGMAYCPRYNVKNDEIIWLGLYAYTQVLMKKQTRYKDLLGLLMKKLKTHGKLENRSSELKYAIDASHSSVLWKIKY